MATTVPKKSRRIYSVRGRLFKHNSISMPSICSIGFFLVCLWTGVTRSIQHVLSQHHHHYQREHNAAIFPDRSATVDGSMHRTDKASSLRMPPSASQLTYTSKFVQVSVNAHDERSNKRKLVPRTSDRRSSMSSSLRNTRRDEGLPENKQAPSPHESKLPFTSIVSAGKGHAMYRSMNDIPVPDKIFHKKPKRKVILYSCKDQPLEDRVRARVVQNDENGTRPGWCLDQRVPRDDVFLAAVTHVRLYPENDKPKLDATDLAHWLTYYRYAGVEKVYLYDSYQLPYEQFENNTLLAAGIESGFIEYIDWSNHSTPNTATFGQIDAYQDAQKRAKARWMTFTDMDEYPYRAADTDEGFLARFIMTLEQNEETSGVAPCERATQYKMKNVIVHGTRGDFTKGPMLVQQVDRIDRTKDATNSLTKQIVRVDAGLKHIIHTSQTKWGMTQTLKPDELLMKHFWGGRVYNWKRTEHLSKSEQDRLFNTTNQNDMADLPSRVLQCFAK